MRSGLVGLGSALILAMAPSTADAGGDAGVVAASSAGCDVARVTAFGLETTDRSRPIPEPEIRLNRPGSYCLDGDVLRVPLWNPLRRSEQVAHGVTVALVESDRVALDLAGHTIANQRLFGVTLIGHFRYRTPGTPPLTHAEATIRSTTIRNGRLISPYRDGIGIRLGRLPGDGLLIRTRPVAIPQGQSVTTFFPETRHLIEDLTIEAGNSAILIDGRDNVIRNNRIIVDSAAAIIAMGPGLVLENNLIEVRDTVEPPGDPPAPREALERFPIRLIQADGAVVRNNRIRFVNADRGRTLPAAIGLVASRAVRIVGNQVLGTTALVAADPESTYLESGNALARVSPQDRSALSRD